MFVLLGFAFDLPCGLIVYRWHVKYRESNKQKKKKKNAAAPDSSVVLEMQPQSGNDERNLEAAQNRTSCS